MSNPKTLTRFSRQSRPDEKILYGRSRGRSRLPFDEAVRKAEAELRAEAARVEPHCAPSVDSFSKHVPRESTSSSADDTRTPSSPSPSPPTAPCSPPAASTASSCSGMRARARPRLPYLLSTRAPRTASSGSAGTLEAAPCWPAPRTSWPTSGTRSRAS